MKLTDSPLLQGICFFMFGILFTRCEVQTDENSPDLILVNGNIITVDSADHIVEAIAIKKNKILAVGSTSEIEALAGSTTKRIDLKKRTVTPGLLDAHIHLTGSPWGIPNLIDLSYPKVKNIKEIKEVILQMAKNLPPGEWIQGSGWDEGKLDERRLVTAKDLDEVSLHHPIWIEHTTGHYGTANSIALQLANIDHSTPTPEGGTIDRDGTHNPTGVLKESAQNLVRGLIPAPRIQDIERGITHMVSALNEEGMTAVKDPGLSDEAWQAYQHLLDSGKLKLRVFGLWPGGQSKNSTKAALQSQARAAAPNKNGNDHLISGGIKFFADGSGGARTAWLYQEWNKDVSGIDKNNYGYPTINPDTLRAMIRLCHNAGIHVSTHAIGDRTIDVVVSGYLDALKANPKKGLRHGIIHCNLPSKKALDILQDLQKTYDAGYPEPSASFTWWIGDTYSGNFGARSTRLNPFATFEKRNIRWGNGSDYPVTPFPARYGIWSAIARQPALGIHGGDPFGRGESVNVQTALRAVTIWAAHQLFLEEKIGSIEVGKYADLAVWGTNLYEIPTNEIKNLKCLMTLFNGEVVFRSNDF